MRVIDELVYLNAQSTPARACKPDNYREALTKLMSTAPSRPEWGCGPVLMPAKDASHVEFFVRWHEYGLTTLHRILAISSGDLVKVVASGWSPARMICLENTLRTWLEQEASDV